MKDSMRPFAEALASRLRKKLARQIRRAAKRVDEETVHDLRVAIRRLSVCLGEFGPFFSRRKTQDTLKRLRKLMHLAGEVRNRDITIELIGRVNRDLASALSQDRGRAKHKLAKALGRWRHIDFA